MSRRGEGPLGDELQHEAGLLHTSGEALYTDDLPPPRGLLVGLPIGSPHARAKIRSRDGARARRVPGIADVIFGADVPGLNQIGPVFHDEPLLAEEECFTEGQLVALIVGESLVACRAAAKLLDVDYEQKPALLDVRQAIAEGSFHSPPHVIHRGFVDEGLAASVLRLSGELESGGQDHFYLETNVGLAFPLEGRALRVISSTQHPSEVQAKVAEVLGLQRNLVSVEVPRLGGGFGGKESQAGAWAALAALAAVRTGRPVKVWLDRDQDMVMTGKRHPFLTRYEAGLDADGKLLALRAELFADGGWTNDLSRAICDRALFHATNCYHVPNVQLTGRVVKTNKASNTAFRGFGGPQGMLLVEEVLARAAEKLRVDPAELRRRNYYGLAPRNRTPYDQEVVGFRGGRIHEELLASSEYGARRAAIERFNASEGATAGFVKRGIGFQPVMFGISFTNAMLNQAGAYVLVYGDGSVQLNHGGTEMGQGLHSKMQAICAHELGLPLASVRPMTTSTEKVPNTSATAASSGADLNGQAVRDACETIRERLRPLAARLLDVPAADAARLQFAGGKVSLPWRSGCEVPFEKVVAAAYVAQVPLSATGFYRTPGITYDHAKGRGKPFHYFAFGGAVTEVEVSGLTGEHRVVRVDILHDCGDSLVPSIDRGQVEGGFVQGLGWLTCEELRWSDAGRLLTHSPSTYKIPAVGDAPDDFRVQLLQDAAEPGVIHGSKAVGEPPLMLAISVVTALRHAVAAFGAPGQEVKLALPCTPEAILRAIEATKDAARAAPAGGEARSVAAAP